MEGKRQARLLGRLRRGSAALCAAAALYLAAVTAGSNSLGESAQALSRAGLAQGLLRWELGDWQTSELLSPATAMVIGGAPALLGAKEEVLELWSRGAAESENESAETPPEGERLTEETAQTTETAQPFADNGVPARTLTPASPAGYTVAGRVYITNATDYALDPAALDGSFAASLGAGEPQVLIMHTHGSEAYTLPEGQSYVSTGDHRTADGSVSVLRVGEVIAAVLAEHGISSVHDRTLYDDPQYNGAYGRSLTGIKGYLEKYPSISFVLDVHRDAITDAQGQIYKVVTETEQGRAAQLTLVMGSDGSGLRHDGWRENLRLAAAVQEKLLEKYPTLMRPILLRNSRYNQHMTAGSLLVEVGAAGNSLDEALLAARLFAAGFAETIRGEK